MGLLIGVGVAYSRLTSVGSFAVVVTLEEVNDIPGHNGQWAVRGPSNVSLGVPQGSMPGPLRLQCDDWSSDRTIFVPASREATRGHP